MMLTDSQLNFPIETHHVYLYPKMKNTKVIDTGVILLYTVMCDSEEIVQICVEIVGAYAKNSRSTRFHDHLTLELLKLLNWAKKKHADSKYDSQFAVTMNL